MVRRIGGQIAPGATGAVQLAGGAGASTMALSVGAIVGIVIGLALWLRPGRGSALAGILFGFYVVVGLLLLQSLQFDPPFVVIEAIGIAAFVLSVVAFWRAGQEQAQDG
jgi:hypothetical protein